MWTLFYGFIFVGLIFVLRIVKNKKILSFSLTVLLALGLGILFGTVLKVHLGGVHSEPFEQILDIVDLVGYGYIKLLHLIAVPFLIVAFFSAFFLLKLQPETYKKTLTLIFFLLFGSLIGAISAAGLSFFFHLNAKGMLSPLEKISELPSISPTGIAVFTILFGIAALQLRLSKPEPYEILRKLTLNIKNITNKLARMIFLLTPYGVFSWMIDAAARQNTEVSVQLLYFVFVLYAAILTTLMLFFCILIFVGLNPLKFFKKSFFVTRLAFMTRNSSGILPIIRATQEQLGIPSESATLASSFVASMGQVGCAGIFPTMLVFMTSSITGVDSSTPLFFISVLSCIAVVSFGVSGIGGGATFAALMVLSLLGFPLILMALLLAIEPIIDMGRTAMNVLGNIFSAIITSRVLRELDVKQYKKPPDWELLKNQEQD